MLNENTKTFIKTSPQLFNHTKGAGGFTISLIVEELNNKTFITDNGSAAESWENESGIINPLFFSLAAQLLKNGMSVLQDGQITFDIKTTDDVKKSYTDLALISMMLNVNGRHNPH